MSLEIKKIHLDISWNLDLYNQECAICRNSIIDDNEESVVGVCGHAFHYNCISKWLKGNKKVCPLCNCKWIYKSKK